MNVLLTTMNLGLVIPKQANLAKELILVLWSMLWKIKNKGKNRPYPKGCGCSRAAQGGVRGRASPRACLRTFCRLLLGYFKILVIRNSSAASASN